MNAYESLIDDACKDGIDITERKFNSNRIKGLYCDGNVALNEELETSTEKTCILAEELGHHHTSVGNILDMDLTGNRKQERQARIWAFNKLIGLPESSKHSSMDVKADMKWLSIWKLQKNS